MHKKIYSVLNIVLHMPFESHLDLSGTVCEVGREVHQDSSKVMRDDLPLDDTMAILVIHRQRVAEGIFERIPQKAYVLICRQFIAVICDGGCWWPLALSGPRSSNSFTSRKL